MYTVTESALGQCLRDDMLALRKPAEPWHKGLELTLAAQALGLVICVGVLAVLWRDLRWNTEKAGVVYFLSVALFLFAIYQIRRLVLKPLTEARKRDAAFAEFRRSIETAETVRIEKIQADEVVSITHDDGTIYLFAIGPDQCFWFEPTAAPANWPNSDFEIVRISGLNEDLGPFCRGSKMQTKASLEFREVFRENFDPGSVPSDGLIQCSLSDFLARGRP